MFNITTVILVLIVLQLWLICWQLVGIMRGIVKVRSMIHDHVHGMTNYLAEIAGETRCMRIAEEAAMKDMKKTLKPVKDGDGNGGNGHGHHHS